MDRMTAWLVLASLGFARQGSTDEVDRIIDEGKNRSQVMLILSHITQDIGPRVTASPELLVAQKWAAAKLASWGLKNVHLEQYGEASVGFQRGTRRLARMVSPTPRELHHSTNNWMDGTNGLVRGRAVVAPKFEEIASMGASLKGAWVLCSDKVGMRGPQSNETRAYREALDAAGIAGRIYSSPGDLLWSHGNWQGKTFESHKTGVEIVLRMDDFTAIQESVAANKPTELEFDLEHRWFKGPIPLYNVVAEIPGTEKPDEVVIVSGHFDSWNTPGSQGAQDNGTGSSVALEAARILAATRVKPKRTIRFVLWSGEEEGLLGSKAYVAAHRSEWPKISAMLNDDGGTTYQGGYVAYAPMRPMLEAAFAPTVRAFPDMPQVFRVANDMKADQGSDHAPFNAVGIPGLDTIESGVGNYMHVWHTQYDRYETCNAKYLVQSATNHAVVSFHLACAPTLLPRGKG